MISNRYKNYRNIQIVQIDTLRKIIFDIIHDLKGTDIIWLDVHKKSSIMDAMIICTGISNRHVITIARDVLRKFRHLALQPYGVEGINIGEWILIDLGDIVVHIMSKENRKLYRLEQLWS